MVYNELDWHPDGTPVRDEDLAAGYAEISDCDLALKARVIAFCCALVAMIILFTAAFLILYKYEPFKRPTPSHQVSRV